ncbi:MAG: hypothetical protein AAGB14_06355 [Verrucomicrobiota bacterium]
MRTEARPSKPNGFTLAAVLVVMAALMLMAVGVLVVVGIERKTARSYVDAKRAEWIARAGMEDFRGRLRDQSADDGFLVVSQPGVARQVGIEPLDLLYLARGNGGGEDVEYDLYPLFSANEEKVTVGDMNEELQELELSQDDPANFTVRERNDDAYVTWIPVEDEDGRTVGRYAYWVEDLQSRVSGKTNFGVESEDLGKRVEWPYPAPGVVEDPDVTTPEFAMHALDPEVLDDEDNSDLDEKLVEASEMMLTPNSVLAAMEFEAPLERDPESGRLEDEMARSLEENLEATVQPYTELQLVPHAPGISEDVAGEPKLNLNRMLADERSSAIDEFAAWVDQALPEFDTRKGGFPEDYLKTLAANAFDYADADNEGTVREGEYRGLDGYPLVSEYLMRFRWEDFERRGSEKFFVLTGAVYIELWNMSDQEVNGTVQLSYETNYTTSLDVLADINLGSAEVLDDPDVVPTQLEKDDGIYWFPEITLDEPLQPNEYRVIKAGEVRYQYPVRFVASPIELMESPRGSSGYRMRWNGVEVDNSRGKIVRREMNLHYPTLSRPETKSRLRQRIEACIPGHSYSVDPNAAEFNYYNNMGDPRMSAYIDAAMAPNKYGNYSPHRRTIRWSTIYNSDSSTKPKVYGRVMPSEWPDGGHDSTFGVVPSSLRREGSEGDQRIPPDASSWFAGLPDPLREDAPMRLSNRGGFTSVCELGRVYDPIMWEPTYDKSSDSGRIRDGFMPSGRSSWPLVEMESAENSQYGGGNTLRIGRAEHPKFELPDEEDETEVGRHAAHLLDLFHVGQPKSDEKAEVEGPLSLIDGKINLNTASFDSIRAMIVGQLEQDPKLSTQVDNRHSTSSLMAPPTRRIELGTPTRERAGDLIAEAIIRERPFASAAEIASVEDESGEKVFGNPELYEDGEDIRWTDSAAEELFARMYEASTLRSRNFRVWVVGQAIQPIPRGSSAVPTVLAESRKVFTVFADPGERDSDGNIDEASYEPSVIHENDF